MKSISLTIFQKLAQVVHELDTGFSRAEQDNPICGSDTSESLGK